MNDNEMQITTSSPVPDLSVYNVIRNTLSQAHSKAYAAINSAMVDA